MTHVTIIHIKLLLIQVKEYLIDLGVVLSLSSLSFNEKLWYAIKNELNEVLLAHLIVFATVALIIRLFAFIFGRWISEEIDAYSDVEFMNRFECERVVFESLKDPHTHIKMYRQNISGFVYDRDKVKIFSKFIGIKTTETFQVIDNGDSVVLKNISGKYESYVTYEFDGSGIVGHWVAKPKGLRRAMSLVLYNVAKRSVLEDFEKFVNKGGV